MKEKNKEKKKKSLLVNDKTVNNNPSKLSRLDYTIMAVLVLVYMVFALFNLGSTNTPKTYYHFTNAGETIGLELTKGKQEISKIRYYNGPETGNYTVMVSDDGESYNNIVDFSANSVFAWEDLQLNQSFKYIMILSNDSGAYLGDIQLYNNYGEKVLVKATSEQSQVVIDELDKVPAKISYKNSTYFDEIYFARSAYEYSHGLNAMEWTHPPLGKLIMTLPIILFGFNPFTFRLMGAIAGILMIPVIYILAKKLFKNSKWALLAGILMAFDNFHLAHTRMATVDSFLVLFILLACLFMKNYIDLDKNDRFKEKAKNLLLSGLFIGCAITTKWTGLYALLGLAIIFFSHLFKQTEDKRRKSFNYKFASRITLTALVVLSLIPIIIYYLMVLIKNTSTATNVIAWYYIIVVMITIITLLIALIKRDNNLKKTFAVCIIAFVVIPVMIYVLSYMLFPSVANYTNNSISGIINQIKDMYTYHSTLTEGHTFESSWYQWPIMYKPVWYYVGTYGGNIKSTIVGIGNPMIWWFGIIAALFVFIKTLAKREKETFFIAVMILCSFVPYIFIGRAMFMYHYFPTLPFVMLAIVAFIKWITEKMKTNMFYIFYIALVIVIFLVFYPITSGMLTTTDYIDSLKWLSSWIF